MFQPGDTVTLMCNPTIQIVEYQFIKAGASVTRVLGEDGEAELIQLELDLKRAVHVAMAREIDVLNGCYGVLGDVVAGDDPLGALLEYCKKEAGDGGVIVKEETPKAPKAKGKKVGQGLFGKKPKVKKPQATHGKGPGKKIGG